MARSLATSPRSHGTMLRVTTQARLGPRTWRRRDVPCAEPASNLGPDGMRGPVHRRGESRRSRRHRRRGRRPSARLAVPRGPAVAPPVGGRRASDLPRSVRPSLLGCGRRRQRRRARRASLAAGVVGAAALATTLAVVLTFVDSKSTSTPASKTAVGAATDSTPAIDDIAHVDARRRTRRHAAGRPRCGPRSSGLEPVGRQRPGAHDRCRAARGRARGDRGLRRRRRVAARRRHRDRQAHARPGGRVGRALRRGGHQHRRRPRAGHLRRRGSSQPNDLDIVALPVCAPRRRRRLPAHPPRPRWGWSKRWGPASTLDGGTDLVNAIEAEMPLGPTSWGGVLLDSHGRVLGILDGQMSRGTTPSGCSSRHRWPKAWRSSSPRRTTSTTAGSA